MSSNFTELGMSGASSRQSQMVADEMFPDGPGPLDFVDVEDGVIEISFYHGEFVLCWHIKISPAR